MTTSEALPAIRVIPIDEIAIANPRLRNKRVFAEIVANIERLGLKRPITVAPCAQVEGARYELVCGQGRLEAFRALGQTDIPALVVSVNAEDRLVMSLVENCARRQHRALDLLHDIAGLKRRGYAEQEIARKTDLSYEYVRGVIRLIESGEHRLLCAVESERIPVSVAVQIADADDVGAQRALQLAYEQNILRGRKLLDAKRVIEQRRRRGKGVAPSAGSAMRGLSADAVLKAYRDETARKRMLIRKAELTRDRLIFITEALRKLHADEHFVTLLRAEGVLDMPASLAKRMTGGAAR